MDRLRIQPSDVVRKSVRLLVLGQLWHNLPKDEARVDFHRHLWGDHDPEGLVVHRTRDALHPINCEGCTFFNNHVWSRGDATQEKFVAMCVLPVNRSWILFQRRLKQPFVGGVIVQQQRILWYGEKRRRRNVLVFSSGWPSISL